ncbi:MAG: hypothetical protein ACRC2S_05340 [Waterburya sp.]
MFDIDSSQNLAKDTDTTNATIAIKSGIWFLGNVAWLFGIIDRSLDIFAQDCLSIISITQLLITLFLSVCWLSLKPNWKKITRKPLKKVS